jgi:cysteine-rich repeat protein
MKTDQWSCLWTVRLSVLGLGGVAFGLGVGATNLEPAPAGSTDRGLIATPLDRQPCPSPEAPQRPLHLVFTEFGGFCDVDEDCWAATSTVPYCVPPPLGQPGPGACYAPTNRYLSMVANPDEVAPTGLRVSLELDQGEPLVLGWVTAAPNAKGVHHVIPDPEYTDWNTLGEIQVADCETSPGYTYLVQAIYEGENIDDEANYSEPLELRTAPIWGDVVSTCFFYHCLPPQGTATQPDIEDFLVYGYWFGGSGPPLFWLDIAPEVPDGIISCADTVTFQGIQYPYSEPTSCPQSNMECGNSIVDPWETCDDGNTTPGDGCDEYCQIEDVSAVLMELIPVGSSGPHSIQGNEIFILAGGQSVTVETFISDWDPDEADIGVAMYQAALDCDSFDSAPSGTLIPDPDGVLVDDSRDDYIYADLANRASTNSTDTCPDSSPGHFSAGAASWCPGAEDPGMPRYGATFVVDVSADAEGTFTLGLDRDPHYTQMHDSEAATIGPITLVPALITVVDSLAPESPKPEGEIPCVDDDECANAAACVQGICYVPKTRYISISPNPENAGIQTARRISLEGFTFDDIVLGWMGPPNEDGISYLQATPEYRYWNLEGTVVHVTECQIAPGQTYLVQAIAIGDDTGDEGNYSTALGLHTAPIWGDVVAGCPNDVCTPPQGDPLTQPDIDDVLALVNAFVGVNNAPFTWLDIDPVVGDGYPEGMVTIGDVLTVVNAFSGQPYPGLGPLDCP